jgi:hypothetical protein
MELINTTRMAAGYNVGLESSGRELLVVVVKGTFVLPQSGEPVRLHAEQAPLVMADTYTGEPGYSAPREEIDFAPRKHACDVLLTGSAHAPPGQQVTRLRVGLRIGPIDKVVEVIGDRVWQAGLTGITASRPQPFTRVPLSYDVAFGGADRYSDDERAHDAYLPNPVGRGWHRHLRNAWVDGTPLPNTEEAGHPVSAPDDRCRPMAYGPLGRAWSPRVRHAGTYDQHWQDHVFPFLPADFDERYYQAAPLDQQMPFPNGPLDVVLSRLTPDGDCRFVLPHFEAPVQVFPRHGEPESHVGRLDTIVLEPDAERLTLTWRVTRLLRKSIFEIARVRVGSAGERIRQAHAGAALAFAT